jgi:hypothetical protein
MIWNAADALRMDRSSGSRADFRNPRTLHSIHRS